MFDLLKSLYINWLSLCCIKANTMLLALINLKSLAQTDAGNDRRTNEKHEENLFYSKHFRR